MSNLEKKLVEDLDFVDSELTSDVPVDGYRIVLEILWHILTYIVKNGGFSKDAKC